jgi:hypothetical protein
MTVQTSFSVDKVRAYAGMIADAGDKDTGNKIATSAVPFGCGVVKRAAPADTVEQCGVPTATADVTARPRGIAVKDESRRGPQSGFPGGYELGDSVTYVKRGRVWVAVEGAVAQDSSAFCRFAAGGGGTVLGAWRADADTATAVAFPTAVFRTSTTGAGFAIVEVNLP